MVAAIFGTTISPYLFFWQAAQEVEDTKTEPIRQPLLQLPHQGSNALARIRLDTMVGMAISNLVALAIMATAAATLHGSQIKELAVPLRRPKRFARWPALSPLRFFSRNHRYRLIVRPGARRFRGLRAGRSTAMARGDVASTHTGKSFLRHDCARHPDWRHGQYTPDQPNQGAGVGGSPECGRSGSHHGAADAIGSQSRGDGANSPSRVAPAAIGWFATLVMGVASLGFIVSLVLK